MESILKKDQNYIWHPLTQHKTQPEVLPITRAKGVWLYDDKENAYIDAISSWYTSIYGHCHPKIIHAAQEQMQNCDQVIFSGFTHAPAANLAEALIGILPENQQKVFFSDNGSTATEIGIKIALQYHHNKGQERHVILAFEEGFHGDTFGAMSVSGLSVYNGPFENHFIKVVRIAVPNKNNHKEVLSNLKKLIDIHDIAGFIYEPLVQGAAGMKMYEAKYLIPILELCKAHEIITIADEVMTGFGKTGTAFASQQISILPDVICLSKALTAGFMPMAITSCTQRIFDAFYSDDTSKGLFHCHTYTANPIACAVAKASVDLLVSKSMQQHRKRIEQSHKEFIAALCKHPKAQNVRSKGIILAFELQIDCKERYGNTRKKIYNAFMAQGIYLRPLGNTIYIVPPFITTNKELQKIYTSIENILELV